MLKNKQAALTLVILFLLGAFVFASGTRRSSPIDPAAFLSYAEGEVLVKFKKGFNLAAAKNFAASQSLQLKKHFKHLSKIKGQACVLLSSPGKADPLTLVNALKNSAEVEFVSPNYRRQLTVNTPNDTRYSELWAMNQASDHDIDAPEAWDISTGSTGVIVAVIDTGLEYNHPDLAANVWTNQAELTGTPGNDDDGNGYVDDIYGIDPAGAVSADGIPDCDPMDGYGHGTHCAGTIGAVGNNSLGVVGVNWNVKIMGLKFFDDAGSGGYDADSIECIEYAIEQKTDYGQNVVAINASWGGTGGGDSGLLRDAIELANDAGIVFCAAAGNGGSDGIGDNNETTHHYPSDYTLPGIISIAATDSNDSLASFSNYGAVSVDLGAPGVGILSTVPRAYYAQSGDIFFDDVEGGVGNWVHSGTKDTWARTTNQEGFANPSFPVPSGSYFWSDSPGVNYSNNTNSYLVYDQNINLESYVGQDIYFGFGAAVYIQYYYDHGYVEFSKDGGSNWTRFYDFTGFGYYWSYYWMPIPDSFKTSEFRMRFHFTSNSSTQLWGWLIDNIGIGAPSPYHYESWGGTSMATPHVSGAVALMASVFSGETVAQRKSRILDWGDSIASLAGKTVTGKRLNLYNSISYLFVPPAITVTAPNGSESWTVGESHDITWTSAGTVPVGNVNIDYSTNNGGDWIPVAVSTLNDGTLTWTIPGTPSTTCLVRVSDTDGSPTDSSDAVFSIVEPAETVSTPDTPSGPGTGLIDTSYSYDTGGSVSNLGHEVQYKFDWDDGSDSGWLAVGVTEASHSWATAGVYEVRAMARCATHTTVESLWSDELTVTISAGGSGAHFNSPAERLILPEVNWSWATGGGDWVSEVQIVDVTGGSVVQVYYNSGTNRRGPFTLWNNTGGAAGSSASWSNMLETIDALDSGAFTYYGTGGSLEMITQDNSHTIQAAIRSYNGNYSRTFPALADVDTNTAALGRTLMVPNMSMDANFRPSLVLFNPSADSVTADVQIIGSDGSQVGPTITKTVAGYEMTGVVGLRDYTYSNADFRVTVTGGSGRLLVSGQSADNVSNDPAAHVAVQAGGTDVNSPATRLIFPEVNWSWATGGGDWVSEVHITDLSGGAVVTAYYNTGTSRRGPFTLWTNGGGANRSVTFSNVLETIDGLDGSAAVYYGTGGALELITQDGSHLIQAALKGYNGNVTRTFPAFRDVEANTAAVGRSLLIPNISNDTAYRPSVALFNPTGDSATVDVQIIGSDGVQIGSTITLTVAGYEMAGVVGLRSYTYSNAFVKIMVTGGSGRVLATGQSANNTSNDPAAHIAVQEQ